MAAISRATARDSRTWPPRKLIVTASAFWIMEIASTISARTLMIRAVRALLTEVRSRRRTDATAGAGAEPLADGGGGSPLLRGLPGHGVSSFQGPGRCCASSRQRPSSVAPAQRPCRGMFPALITGCTYILKLATIFRKHLPDVCCEGSRARPSDHPAEGQIDKTEHHSVDSSILQWRPQDRYDHAEPHRGLLERRTQLRADARELSGPYNVTAPATGGCPPWHLDAIMTSQ